MFNKQIVLFLFLLLSRCSYAQDSGIALATLKIVDSCVKMQDTDKALKLTIDLSLLSDHPMVLFGFFEHVLPNINCASSYEDGADLVGNYGLSYVIKDERGNYVDIGPSRLSFVSCDNVENESRHYDSRWFVDKRDLSVSFMCIEDAEDRKKHDLAKLSVSGTDTLLHVYPIVFSKDKQLLPGKYKLFLLYCQNDKGFSFIYDKLCTPKESIFWGVIKSNEIDLVVENHRHKWWKKWKRKKK